MPALVPACRAALVAVLTVALVAEPTAGDPTPAQVDEIRCALYQKIDESTIHEGIREDRYTAQPLLAQIVRLSFHDCVGGCDGFIDLEQHGNDGLVGVKAILDDLYDNNGYSAMMSRADWYAMAGTLAVFKAARNQCRDNAPQPDMALYFGRVDATESNGAPLPNPHGDFEHAMRALKDAFGFSTAEAVAIMGAHTLGSVHEEVSGVEQTGPWTKRPHVLDNQYFQFLCDKTYAQQSFGGGMNVWKRTNVGNGHNSRVFMLNVDMALAREVQPSRACGGLAWEGIEQRCARSSEECPFQPPAGDDGGNPAARVAELAASNALFVQEFAAAFVKMVKTQPADAAAELVEVPWSLVGDADLATCPLVDECARLGMNKRRAEHDEDEDEDEDEDDYGKADEVVEVTSGEVRKVAVKGALGPGGMGSHGQTQLAAAGKLVRKSRGKGTEDASRSSAGAAGSSSRAPRGERCSTLSVPWLGICV